MRYVKLKLKCEMCITVVFSAINILYAYTIHYTLSPPVHLCLRVALYNCILIYCSTTRLRVYLDILDYDYS